MKLSTSELNLPDTKKIYSKSEKRVFEIKLFCNKANKFPEFNTFPQISGCERYTDELLRMLVFCLGSDLSEPIF